MNWSPVMKNGATLKTGDVVSVSGKGRLKVNHNFYHLAYYSVNCVRKVNWTSSSNTNQTLGMHTENLNKKNAELLPKKKKMLNQN